jgi:hypothetical protein
MFAVDVPADIRLVLHAVLCCAVSEKSAHLSKLLEPVKWRVMGYKGDDADGQPLSHPVSAAATAVWLPQGSRGGGCLCLWFKIMFSHIASCDGL